MAFKKKVKKEEPEPEKEYIDLGNLKPSMKTGQAIAKMTDALTDEKKKRMMSELDDIELMHVATLYALNKKYKSDSLEEFLDALLVLKVSKGRMGRQEVIRLAEADREKQQKQQRGLWDKITSIIK